MEITKNRLSNDEVLKIVNSCFENKKVKSVVELEEGMFNAAYNISFEDGTGSVLKVAPKTNKGLMSNEINLMKAEIKAMEIMRKYNYVHVAEVYVYDTSHSLCDSDYFFMERLDGENWLFVKEGMTKEQKELIHKEIGCLQNKMTGINNQKFGLLGDLKEFTTLYDFFYYLMNNILDDIYVKSIDIGIEKDKILERLVDDKKIFDEVKTPSLVHWDMWEGNIFVKDNHLSGIIDWERAMWGEAFMDDRFRRHNRNEYFLKGFGKSLFSDDEMRRINWYDILLYLTMMAEVTYREYSDDGQFYWVKPLFDEAWNDLCII